MRREEKFVQSHAPYAVAVDGLRIIVPDNAAEVRAVWFRRRKGVTVACIGYLWDHLRPGPASVAEFLARSTDGCYGGTCEGRWDSERYWGAQQPEVIERHLALLRPMLANFPDVPPGYEGWWTYRA